MAAVKHTKIKLREVNRHLVCRLCRGYYVDATTIAECLHSFCRSCIIKYLEKNSFCPICEVQIHKTKPYLNLRLDKALQDVVYKVVPGLYHDEMKRRRKFYSLHQEQIPVTTPEQCGLEERIIFSPEDSISLSLEYLESDDYDSETVSSQSSESGDNPEGLSFPQQLGLMKLKNNEGRNSRRESQDVPETSSFHKRYLRCPAVVNVSHLKKFIRMKHELTDKMQVDIIHKRVPLPDHYTLMDVAYIYTWKRSAPLRFFYQIYQTKRHKVKALPALPEAEESKPEAPRERESSDPLKDAAEGKLQNGEIPKPLAEANKNCLVESKPEILTVEKSSVSEIKQSTNKNASKGGGENNKPVSEGKSETSAKSEAVGVSVNGVKSGSKEDLPGNNSKSTDSQKCNKSDKPGSVGGGASESKNKPDVPKRKSSKVENNGGSREVKENQSNDRGRFLLNPISGQLESVPSTDQNKGTVNGTVVAEEKKESSNAESVEKESANKGQKKVETETQRESKKSSVNLLKSFRKEKPKESKVELKSGNGNSLTITAVPKVEKPAEKETVKVSVEIKAENKGSEYDFDGTSPPSKIIPLQEFSKYSKYSKYMSDHREKWLSKESGNSWMSLQDFRQQMLKENSTEDPSRKYKRKSVPSLYKIGAEGNKKSGRKTPNGKLMNDKPKAKKAPSPTIINIQTENEDKKTEIKIEVPGEEKTSPPRPFKIENKGGEYSIKQKEESPAEESKPSSESTKSKESKEDSGKTEKQVTTDAPKSESGPMKVESEKPSKDKTNAEETKSENCGAIDLSKTETSPKSRKNPLENLIDMANKTGSPKSDEKMVEALISVAQKQSIEPLLKIPQFSQNSKNPSSQGSPPLAKNISSNDISQALQFFKDLRSDLKVLEAKSQLSPNSVLEQFSQKSANLEPIQLYQQHIDLIRRLKRQHMADADTPQRKQMKLSPTSESKRKLSPPSEPKAKKSPIAEDAVQFKSSVDRTLSQIQDLMEFQSRMVAAQNYKNLPALLQYYNRPPSFCPGPTSPSKSGQQKPKSSGHSPPSGKSPQTLMTPSGSLSLAMPNSDTSSFFNSQNYNHLINAGLNSEMTFHQMFQNYLNQQDKMNQIKHSPGVAKKPPAPPAKSDSFFGPQTTAKKPETNASVPAVQKT